MATNHNYYDIEIADIWQYEQNEFLGDRSSDDLAKKIINKAEEVIIKEGEESFTVDLDNADSRAYYERNLNECRESSNTLKGRYKINFFFNKHICYQYDQHIIVTKENPDFDFWFALKLRQYDSRLIEISNYLDFQKQTNFNKDIARINDFLKVVTMQFKDELISDRVVGIVEDWIENHSEISKDEKEVHSVDDRIILRIKYDSSKLLEVFKPYFDEKEHEKLNSLLTENEIKDKICFKSNANQFVMVFRQLHLNQQIVGNLVNTEKWICKYFTYYGQNKKYSDFNPTNVHKILTRRASDIPKSKRIDLPGLEYIKKN
jgi:hypothetical protein